jgi:DNA relaxase NicK
LAFRTQAEVPDGLYALRGLYPGQADHLKLRHLTHGKDGFQQACAVHLQDLQIGRVDFGGESQRGWVRWNLTGQGCEWVEDWDAVQDLEALPKAEIRRVDVALTTWEGEVGHETIEAAHASGLFRCGGRPPDMRTILNTNPRAGRTCEVGKREQDKFFRGYEKGFELAAKSGREGVTHIDGFPVEDIYRCEVELKPKTTTVPWEIVERRDQYFAGCYPFLAELLPGVDGDILMRRPERAPQTSLKAALANCRLQYGATIFTALAAYGGDVFRVWDQIRGDSHNLDLVAAGVLMVEHD